MLIFSVWQDQVEKIIRLEEEKLPESTRGSTIVLSTVAKKVG